MTPTMHLQTKMSRKVVRGAVGAVVSAALLAGCNDFLRVENPGAIEAAKLNDPAYLGILNNGVIGEFQRNLPQFIYYASLYSDEIRNHGVFFEERLYDLRAVEPQNGTLGAFQYNPLHRARFLADSAVGRYKAILGDSAKQDLRVARALAYSALMHSMLAEWFCTVTLDGGAPQQPDAVFGIAVQKADSAITIAQAAKAYLNGITPKTAAINAAIAGADSVENFARVAGARAALGKNDKAKAIALATPVPAAFEFRSYYSTNSTQENLYYYGRLATSAGSGSITGSVTNTPFANLADPRVPHPAATERVQDASNALVPNAPSSFSMFNNTVIGADFTQAGYVRIASGLEAQYIIAEATGPTTATIAFVEGRRLIAPASPRATVATTAANFMDNLMEQRSRDFFLDGHRLGDMRRWKALYSKDFFQHGLYPGTTTGETYSETFCLPLTLAEIQGNPNVPKGP
jgi:starch-binding outer membrane protein, SusD/RagB family